MWQHNTMISSTLTDSQNQKIMLNFVYRLLPGNLLSFASIPIHKLYYPHECTDWYELCFTGMLQRLGPDRSSIDQIKKERWVSHLMSLAVGLFELVFSSAVLLSSTLCDKIRFLNNIHVVFLSQHCGVYCGIAFVYQRIVRCNWIQSLFYTCS